MAKQVRDAMTTHPAWVEPSQSIVEAARMMEEEDVGSLPVCQNDRLVGILTDRDIVVRTVAQAREPSSVTVGDVASKDLKTVRPDQDLDEALQLMAQEQVRRLPVVEDGKLVGVLAQADVAEHAADAQAGRVLEQISR